MKPIFHEYEYLEPAFYDILCGAKKLIAYKLYKTKGNQWSFKGTITYPNCQDIDFVMKYHDDSVGEEFIITGKCTLSDGFSIKEANFDFHVYDERKKKLVGFDIDIADKNHLEDIERNIVELLNNNRDYRYFCDDYKRYTKENPFEYIKSLLINGLITMKETVYDNVEGETYCYTGEYGEDTFEIVIDDCEYEGEIDFYPLDTINVNVADRFVFYYSQINAKEIRKLIPLMKKIQIPINDFLVRINTFGCINKDHQLNRVKALVYIDDGKNVREVSFNALYCVECRQYFISELEYQKLKEQGRICCRIITITEFKKIQDGGYHSWAEQSLLRSYGYTVSAQANLTDNERRRILSFIIENDIMKPVEVIHFIEWLISRNSSKNFNLARTKWNRDINYIRNYQPVTGIVKVGDIYKKSYKPKINDMFSGNLPFN